MGESLDKWLTTRKKLIIGMNYKLKEVGIPDSDLEYNNQQWELTDMMSGAVYGSDSLFKLIQEVLNLYTTKEILDATDEEIATLVLARKADLNEQL